MTGLGPGPAGRPGGRPCTSDLVGWVDGLMVDGHSFKGSYGGPEGAPVGAYEPCRPLATCTSLETRLHGAATPLGNPTGEGGIPNKVALETSGH